MFGTVKEARCALEDAAFELDAARLLLPDVEGMLDELGKIKRLADGMIGQVARRVGDAKAVARALHVSTGEVRGAMETAELVEELPALDAAVRRGELSAREAQLIAAAANVNIEGCVCERAGGGGGSGEASEAAAMWPARSALDERRRDVGVRGAVDR